MPYHYLRHILLAYLVLQSGLGAFAYSLLTHEQLIDLTWSDSIVPLLLGRYPNLTPAQVEQARAYAYGGCVIQDLGYYPFGDKSFSNLTHYVRSGDFVVSLFRNAHSANELAFAVGALSHYIGDSIGHPEATNSAVPIEFPALGKRYGPSVSYAEGEQQHVRTEFGFDINQIAHHHMAPLSFARHMGLKVPERQLGLAFYETYGIADFAGYRGGKFNIREYRFAVRTFIPRIAYAVTLLRRKNEPPEPATPDAIEIQKEVAEAETKGHWGQFRRKPGFETYSLACLLFVLPRIGPFALADVRGPTAQTETDYLHSLMLSLQALRANLLRFTPRRAATSDADQSAVLKIGPPDPTVLLPVASRREREQQSTPPRHLLPNRDLDTGRVVQPGGYSLTDQTYAKLLRRLTKNPKRPLPPGIVRDIEDYYSDPAAPIITKRNSAQWALVQADLRTLAEMPVNPEPAVVPTYDGDQH